MSLNKKGEMQTRATLYYSFVLLSSPPWPIFFEAFLVCLLSEIWFSLNLPTYSTPEPGLQGLLSGPRLRRCIHPAMQCVVGGAGWRETRAGQPW